MTFVVQRVFRRLALSTVAVACALMCRPAAAYIGAYAGFTFIGSFLVMFATFALAFVSLLTWPVRWLVRLFRRKKPQREAQADRVIILGFDGLDPGLAERFMSAGLMPHFADLRDGGTFSKLGTTYPATSPAAWSSFRTGSNPGEHGIFDLLKPDRHTYAGIPSIAGIRAPRKRFTIGPFAIPLGKPYVGYRRESRSFWSVLGEHGIFSEILRVPTTFPPEKFNGVMLSAGSVPDMLGTEGTFSFYTTRTDFAETHTGGETMVLEKIKNRVRGDLIGPANFMRREPKPMRIPFTATVNADNETAVIKLNGKKLKLRCGEYSPWINVQFRAAPGVTVDGICRLLVKETFPEFSMYVTPINIDPERPAMPISHPPPHSVYLAKLRGSFATAGLAEDTRALDEDVIDESEFLEQVYSINHERESMCLDAIDRTRRGMCVCVFDAPDRVQHMFMRYLDPDHPANRGRDTADHNDAVKDVYCAADTFLGRVMERVDKETVLLVISGHGFAQFARGVNLNAWLRDNGYLAMKEGAGGGGEWFDGVDWGRTRAYALGLGGIYINIDGREAQGIVKAEERDELVKELVGRLRGLVDDENGHIAVKDAYDCRDVLSGPHVDDAPDVVVGYARGYRASWDGVTGSVGATVFEDNARRWSGDHCINPADVPGILFCNRKVSFDSDPDIRDIGPTVLNLFGIEKPDYMNGRPFKFGGDNE